MVARSRLSLWGVCGCVCWLVIGSACSEPLRALDARAQAIYYGDPEDRYDGVVMLTIALGGRGGAMCTGTLVAPRVVTTA